MTHLALLEDSSSGLSVCPLGKGKEFITMAEEQQFSIPYPDPIVFGKAPQPPAIQEIGTIAAYEFDRAEYPPEGGILTFKKGLLYPTKGFVFPQAIQCVNVAKRLFIDTIYFYIKPRMIWLYIALVFVPFKRKVAFINDILSVYNRSSILVVKAIAPDRKYLIDVSRELWGIIETFLLELGIEPENALMFAQILSVCLNYDNAYHLRLIDIFSETNKGNLLENPAKEMNRVLAIYKEREIAEQVITKFKAISLILHTAFLSNKVKQAFRKAINQADFTKLQYDDIDRYNVLERGDYNFLGKTWPERIQIFKFLHKGSLPKQLQI